MKYAEIMRYLKANKWLPVLIVAVIFVGARQLYDGGIFAIARDTANQVSIGDEMPEQQEKMLRYLLPIGAAVLCMKKFGKDDHLAAAAQAYNDRHERQMAALVREIEEAGGMTEPRKAQIDRLGYRRVVDFLGDDAQAKDICAQLADRINSGEFDQ